VREVSTGVTIPVITSGGMGGISDFAEVVVSGHADAVAVASVFHYGEITVMDLRREAISRGIKVRNVEA
jgi:cyclase